MVWKCLGKYEHVAEQMGNFDVFSTLLSTIIKGFLSEAKHKTRLI